MDTFVALLLISLTACSSTYQIDIASANARSYQNVQNSENQFKYGYQVYNVNDQFQHKHKSADNVTYGCYGYTYPKGEGVHRTFFVADQFGYRTVLAGQQFTIYPAPGTSAVLKEWQEIFFPAACFGNGDGNVENAAFSASSNVPVVDASNRGRSGLEFDSSNFQPIAVPYDQEQSGSDVDPITAKSTNHYQGSDNLTDNSNSRGSINSQSKGNSHNKINSEVSRNSQGSIDSQGSHSTQDSNESQNTHNSQQCWRPFAGNNGKSFMQSLQCELNGKPENEVVTLFFPFRIACADMIEFEQELNLLVSKFNH